MTEHPINVKGYESDTGIIDLARQITDLRYDKLADLFHAISVYIKVDAIQDEQRGRHQLSRQLKRIVKHLETAHIECEVLWQICAPYMLEENNK